MPYLLYARKSQESEERQIQSIDDQRRLCHDFAAKNGLLLQEEITESKSAKEPDQRLGFARMLALIRQGTIDGILAWHPDRLSRNELDAAALTYLLRKGILRDVQFVTYTFTNSPEGIMMLQMALSQSQYYSAKLAKDVTRGMDSKIAKGWCPHRAPEGYLNDKLNRTIIADPLRFPLIRQAWQLMLSGGFSVGQIVRLMNQEWGYTTRATTKRGGGPLSLSAAYLLFRNPYYTGCFLEKGVLHPGKHLAMITQAEFEQVQRILALTGKPQPKKHSFAYTGLIRCRCGAAVTAELKHDRTGKRHYVYYHCIDRTRGRDGVRLCSKKSIREDDLEAQIEAILREVTLEPETMAFARAEVARWREQEAEKAGSAIAERQELSLEELKEQRRRLLGLHLRGSITEAVFADKQAELTAQIEQLSQAQVRQRTALERAERTARNSLRFREAAHARFLAGTVHEKREIARALGLCYRFDHGEVTIDLHPALLPHITIGKTASNSTAAGGEESHTTMMGFYSDVSAASTVPLVKFETVNIGSGSTKKGAFAPPLPFGGADLGLAQTPNLRKRKKYARRKAVFRWEFFSTAPEFPQLLCLQ